MRAQEVAARAQESRARANHAPDEQALFVDVTPPDSQNDLERLRERFNCSPNAARAQYIHLRETAWRDRITRLTSGLRAKRESLTTQLRDLGEQIRRTQVERGTVESELSELEQAQLDGQDKIPDKVHLDAEFDRLMSLPGIEGVRVVNDEIRLLFRAQVQYEGSFYRAGIWEFRFGGKVRGLDIRKLDDVEIMYPNGQGFCLGTRADVVHENALKGQYLEAVELAIDSMQSVNNGHEVNIPSNFRPERRVS